jgi:hypothetical protein
MDNATTEAPPSKLRAPHPEFTRNNLNFLLILASLGTVDFLLPEFLGPPWLVVIAAALAIPTLRLLVLYDSKPSFRRYWRTYSPSTNALTALAAYIILLMAFLIVLKVPNALLDFSEPIELRFELEHLCTDDPPPLKLRRRSGGPACWVLAMKEDGTVIERDYIPASLKKVVRNSTSKQFVTMKIRSGLFGTPWVESYTLRPDYTAPFKGSR